MAGSVVGVKERTEKTERIPNKIKRQLVETDKKVDETTKKFKMGESLVRQEAEGICCVFSILHEKSWVFTSCCYDGSAGIYRGRSSVYLIWQTANSMYCNTMIG